MIQASENFVPLRQAVVVDGHLRTPRADVANFRNHRQGPPEWTLLARIRLKPSEDACRLARPSQPQHDQMPVLRLA